jgi:hypothetical protein
MSSIYLDSDTIEAALRALCDGVPLEILAGRLRVRPEELAKLLGLPADQSRGRAAADSGEVDLWASAEGVL